MKNLANYQICFPIVLVVLLGIIIFFDLKYCLLRDSSTAEKKPYSFSKVQMAFWLIVFVSAFVTIIFCVKDNAIPTFANSTLIILGISTATLTAGRLIDVADQMNPNVARTQDEESQGFFLDILSDENGVSLHRLQCLVFNVIIGGWVCFKVLANLGMLGTGAKMSVDNIIPDITPNNLVLLGISSGTYIALKTNENKPAATPVAAPIIVPATTGDAMAIIAPLIKPALGVISASEPEFLKDEAGNINNPAAG